MIFFHVTFSDILYLNVKLIKDTLTFFLFLLYVIYLMEIFIQEDFFKTVILIKVVLINRLHS